MREIKIEEVQDVLKKEKSNITLINVLSSSSFEGGHIPHSVNVPVESPNFVKQVESQVVDHNAPVIVYCSGPECPASKNAAAKLEDAGFTNVMHFHGGMDEWKNAEQEIEIGF
ncbi:MAG: rhodanese-like domain-containing protein [Chlamydiales bacterium]|nr:rhodanese-like domain-containing protein [Chlamydiales bacterium]